MGSVDVPVALLGYGTVGAAVNRLLTEGADDIERATGHRLRVVRALVRDTERERSFPAGDGVLTTDFESIASDSEIAVVAEVMGGVDETGEHVLRLLRSGRPVVSANKQLIARRGDELFDAASEAGVQLRFEASVCAAIPVIKVLRESLVVTNVHRILGIVNGTTNFMLTRMEAGDEYDEALAEAQRLGYAEADPTEDVTGADAAAKMAILATVAFGSRVRLDDVSYEGIERIRPDHVHAAHELGMAVRLIGSASLIGDAVDVRVEPAFVDRNHPLAAVDGAVQRRHVAGRRDPRDHARRPRRRRSGDGLGRGRGYGQRHRHDGHGLPPERRVVAHPRAAAAGRPALGVLPLDRGRRPPGRACPRRAAARRGRRLGGAAQPAAAERGGVARHRHAPGVDGQRPRGGRSAGAPARGPRRAGRDSRRLRARMTALIERYRGRLPVGDDVELVTLGEGSTPLLWAPRLSKRLHMDVWLKCEGANPTGSFKDRGMTVAVTLAKAEGVRAVVCASTGNTAASSAAYAARAGLPALVLQPAGAVALGKLAQAMALGAKVLEVRGTFDEALAAARALADRGTHALVNSLNPHRIQGQKTAAFEIVDELGNAPDVLALPYGGGGNTCSYEIGFEEEDDLPRIVSVQAAERRRRRPRRFASPIPCTTPRSMPRWSAAAARS